MMEDADRLESCITALRDIVGESVPREELVRVALAADYDANRALNFFFSWPSGSSNAWMFTKGLLHSDERPGLQGFGNATQDNRSDASFLLDAKKVVVCSDISLHEPKLARPLKLWLHRVKLDICIASFAWAKRIVLPVSQSRKFWTLRSEEAARIWWHTAKMFFVERTLTSGEWRTRKLFRRVDCWKQLPILGIMLLFARLQCYGCV